MAGKGTHIHFLDREIRMVLVGKTGVGKSETGNTIIMSKQFEALPSAASVTKKCEQHCFTRFGYDLQLVDVPGFYDTSRSHEDIKYEIIKCVGMSSPGIHAILFNVRIGRMAEEDKKTLESFLHCFGEEAKRFVIVVFTGKDDLQAETDTDTIDKYIRGCPGELKQFLLDTSNRYIAVNNRGTEKEKKEFTEDLIRMVKCMVGENGGQCYTNGMYERWEADLKKAEKKEKLEGKRQEQFEKRLKQEAAALEKKLKSQRPEMHETKKQREWKRTEQKDEEHLGWLVETIELTHEDEDETKRLEEENKRKADQKEAEEYMNMALWRMKSLHRTQMEEFERMKEELRLEEARKQIREKVDKGNIGFIRTTWKAVHDIASSLW